MIFLTFFLLVDQDPDLTKTSKRSYKTLLTFFVCGWKDPDLDADP